MALILYFQRLPVEPFAFTDRAGDPDIGQKVHLHARGAVALASLAPAAFYVEAEPARFISTDFRLRRICKQRSDVVEHFGIGGRIGPRCPANGRLIDVDHLVQVLAPFDFLIRARFHPGSVEFPCQHGVQNVVN